MTQQLPQVNTTAAHPLGDKKNYGQIILRGPCPFCGDMVTFRQITEKGAVGRNGVMLGILCEGCNAVLSYHINKNKIYPKQELKGLTNLPPDIQKYYDEALRCISADSPNGAVTLFRKIIHAIGIHYDIAKKNDDKSLYSIIGELHNNGHIVMKLRDALMGIKDIGNDGAHINENEPDIDQANKIRSLIDTILTSTIIADSTLNQIKEAHVKNKK
ncbi:MAG: DUF4145 domain-containing protein [Thermoplasmata archaeon]